MAEKKETKLQDQNHMADNQTENNFPDLLQIELENQRLREENQRLKEYRASLPLKERLYDRIPLTAKQMDWIVGFLLLLLIAVLAMGLINR